MPCACKQQLQPHDALRGVCDVPPDEPCGKPVALYGVAYGDLYDPRTLPAGHSGWCDPLGAQDVRQARIAAAERLANDPIVVAYDELDLRIIADMEGGH